MICITFSGDFFWKMSSELKNFTRAGELGAIKENTPLWDIAVFGTTQVFHALDFFPVTDVKGVNLAFEVQPFLYDAMLLKRFAGNIRKGGIVLFGIAPCNFMLYDFFPSMRNSYHFKRYYLMCGAGFHASCSPAEACLVKLKYFFKSVFHRLSFCRKCNDNDFSATPEALEKDAVETVKDLQENFFHAPDFKYLIDESVIQKNIDILCGSIGFARSSGLKPILMLVPNSPAFYRALDEDVMKRYFWEPLEQVVRKTSVPVMDLMMEPLFAANENYLDALSMSAAGRKKFTEHLVNIIKSGDYA